jgi:DNA ligase-1
LRPYLAKRINTEKIRDIFNGTKFYIEEKYDGERIQLHFDENEIKFFSRNCFDATDLYLPHFKSLIKNNIRAESAILDGEMIVVDKFTFESMEFGKNRIVAQDRNHEKY